LFAFYDLALARVARSSSGSWRTETLQGIGGGIVADTRLGRLEIALAVDPARGAGAGRLHVRLAESF
jgi:hypothetical protein